MNTLNEQRAQIITEQLLNLQPEDVTPMTQFTTRPEYTLVAHLPEEITHRINAIVRGLKTHFPAQYYYSPSQYHVTIVPVPYTMELAQIIERIAPVVKNWRLPVHARGVVANRLQAGAVFYPEKETLVPHRMKLRAALDIPDQAFTTHNPIWEELLWSNFMRFTTKPEAELLDSLRSRIDQDLGGFVLSRYDLYEISTITLDPASSRHLYAFDA